MKRPRHADIDFFSVPAICQCHLIDWSVGPLVLVLMLSSSTRLEGGPALKSVGGWAFCLAFASVWEEVIERCRITARIQDLDCV